MVASALKFDDGAEFRGLDRMASAQSAAALERLQGSSLLSEGRVVLIGLDAVRARLGGRWASKREPVWEHVERCLARQMGPAAFVVRVSETEYLVAQPQIGRYAAQAACLSVLREVLTFFLGEALPADLSIREVTALTPQGVTCTPVDPAGVTSAALSEAPSTAPAPDPADASPDRWSPFTTADGRVLKVSCLIDPVFEMQQVRMIGHRLEPRVVNLNDGATLDAVGLRALSPGERERVDLATIARGVSRLRTRPAGKPLLMLPAAFTTLGSSRGRAAMTLALKESKIDQTTRIVCEVRELDGVPTSRLSEAVSLVKPFCYAVVGRVGDDRRSLLEAARGGFAGFSLDLQERDLPDMDFLQRLHAFTSLARDHARVCMALGLRSPKQLALSRVAGVSHASMRVEADATGASVT
ncbi:MAG TPA: hypothetical protein VD929_11795 [Caulobacteraceae bacterium]|nr:hypothetical protein [Caulobacteraceae bacterium]